MFRVLLLAKKRRSAIGIREGTKVKDLSVARPRRTKNENKFDAKEKEKKKNFTGQPFGRPCLVV